MQEAVDSLNFEEQILEAAWNIAIMNATSPLVKSTTHAQHELVGQSKLQDKGPTLKDTVV